MTVLIWLSWGAWSYSCKSQSLRTTVGTKLSPHHSLLSVSSMWLQLTDTKSTALVLRSSNQRNEKNWQHISRATRLIPETSFHFSIMRCLLTAAHQLWLEMARKGSIQSWVSEGGWEQMQVWRQSWWGSQGGTVRQSWDKRKSAGV